jgi:hypothetical protein
MKRLWISKWAELGGGVTEMMGAKMKNENRRRNVGAAVSGHVVLEVCLQLLINFDHILNCVKVGPGDGAHVSLRDWGIKCLVIQDSEGSKVHKLITMSLYYFFRHKYHSPIIIITALRIYLIDGF